MERRIGVRLCLVVSFLAALPASAASAAESAIGGDVNCDGRVDLADAICTLNWLFLGGPDLCPIPDGAGLRARIAELEAALDSKTAEADQCQEDLLTSRAEAIAALQDLLGCRTSLADTEAALQAKTADLAACEDDLQATEAERDSLAADLQATEADLAAAETARDLCQDTLAQLNPELATCVASLAASEASLSTCTGNLSATEQELAASQAALAAAQARIVELESGAALAEALARIDELEVPGCMDPAAANYNCQANVADGSCQYPGCTDPAAQNYDPQANVNDGTCRYPCTTDCPTIPGFTLLGDNEQLYAEYVHDQTGIVFVLLPGGTFMMGSSEDEPERNLDEGPLHPVLLSPFLMAKYELAQASWTPVMGSNPAGFRADENPVERITWFDAKEYCQRTGLKLPTEAQWEYACRGNTRTTFAFGPVLTRDLANISGTRTMPVASFVPNPFGLYQMHGNVAEWCEDNYDEFFYTMQQSSGPDPLRIGGSTPWYRCLRGGGYAGSAGESRSANRAPWQDYQQSTWAGVRLAYWPLP